MKRSLYKALHKRLIKPLSVKDSDPALLTALLLFGRCSEKRCSVMALKSELIRTEPIPKLLTAPDLAMLILMNRFIKSEAIFVSVVLHRFS